MKSTKDILLGLAGAWIVLLFSEKVASLGGAVRRRNQFLPLRLIVGFCALLKSLLLLGLVLFNVFLAISFVDSREKNAGGRPVPFS